MNTVVILDKDRKEIVNYKRMLASFREKMDCKFFQYPEEAIAYVTDHPVAVLVSELEMPMMSGKEVFEMVEMISPFTVKIAMTQVRDVGATLDIINRSRIFRLIVKPFFLVEDLVNPIQSALECYEIQEKERNGQREKEIKLERLNGRIDELSQRLEIKKQKYKGICQAAVGIVKGNVSSETAEISKEAGEFVAGACEELLQEFLLCYMFEKSGYLFQANKLKNRFHHPKEACFFQIKNKTGQEVPEDVMKKISYGMFLGGYLCQQMFEVYRTAMMIEREESFYVLRMFCQYSKKGKVYKISDEDTRQLLRNIMEEIARALSIHMVSGTREKRFAVKLYFKSEVEAQ